MFRINKSIAMKASLVALLSTAVSVAVSGVSAELFGGSLSGVGLWMSVLLPLGIGGPASAYQFAINARSRRAHEEMERMHAELQRLHKELIIAHAGLQQKARVDGLTGALNRETFMARLEAASTREHPSALLIADADHFKQINDVFGHQCGDDALRGISAAIATALRTDDFCGRIGGEEFAIYLDGADEVTAAAIADMIRLGTLGIDLSKDDRIVPVSISIGGVCSASRFNSRLLMAEADRRLYIAKRAGRNRVVMHDSDAATDAA
jgi:diguanylate cyclase (GGDEF)-like protein